MSSIVWLEQGRHLWETLVDLLFPPRCAHCRQPGTHLCQNCLNSIPAPPDPRCPHCDLSLVAYPCPACRQPPLNLLDGLRVVAPYQTLLRSAIHALKYQRRRPLAVPLGSLLARYWEAHGGAGVDALLPVPLHPARERERGFNQAALLAGQMGNLLDLPVRMDLLRRERKTASQVSLSRVERLENVAGAFAASGQVAGGCWLLVDDVCTTGATLGACATALRAAGAERIWAITLARAVDARDGR